MTNLFFAFAMMFGDVAVEAKSSCSDMNSAWASYKSEKLRIEDECKSNPNASSCSDSCYSDSRANSLAYEVNEAQKELASASNEANFQNARDMCERAEGAIRGC